MKRLITRLRQLTIFGTLSFFAPFGGLILGLFLINSWPWPSGGHPPSLIPPGLIGGVLIGSSLGALLGLIGVCQPERFWGVAVVCGCLNFFIATAMAIALHG
jgi:uncharacterized membrane protein